MEIGQIISCNKEIVLNPQYKTIELEVTNKGDRPIQVGSHFHFFEVNKLLSFDRQKAFGYRLDIPSGMSVRFEPGETKKINLCEFGGSKALYGLNNLTSGLTVGSDKEAALTKAKNKGFIKE